MYFSARVRDPCQTVMCVVQILGIIFGLIYWQQNLDQHGISNINGALFMSLTQLSFGFIFNVAMVSNGTVAKGMK
jgi:hypothetical protein